MIANATKLYLANQVGVATHQVSNSGGHISFHRGLHTLHEAVETIFFSLGFRLGFFLLIPLYFLEELPTGFDLRLLTLTLLLFLFLLGSAFQASVSILQESG